MDTPDKPNDAQTTLWNGTAGHAWVDAQPVLDGLFEPLQELLAQAASAQSARSALDVGCGTGSTTLALVRGDVASRHAVGIDLSEPMIAMARQRAEREGLPASFIRADAQTHAFEPGSFDLIVSRFGVMFFDDPVAAFANLRRAAMVGAVLRAIVWRTASENPFMTTAERAAAPLLPNMPARKPDGPGQFAFADRSKVQGILETCGWVDIDLQSIDVTCSLPKGELLRYITRLGPLGLFLKEVDEQTRAEVIEKVLPAFDPFVVGDEVRFTAACWMVGARAPSAL
ncbi:MAG: class I SAM-dependent methyltransferase [Polyangiaceae bacterium]|nr:class I SAM-dependent methyltransferase [Polyangiaceae bacterium]